MFKEHFCKSCLLLWYEIIVKLYCVVLLKFYCCKGTMCEICIFVLSLVIKTLAAYMNDVGAGLRSAIIRPPDL